MSNGHKKRPRVGRVAPLELPPGRLLGALLQLRRREVLARLLAAVVAALSLWAVCGGWAPPFSYRAGDVPPRDILAAVTFREPDPVATEQARQRAREQARYVYTQDPKPLVQLRAALHNLVVVVNSAATYEDLDQEVWRQFQLPLADGTMPRSREQEEEQFEQFREALAGDRELTRFQQAVAAALGPFERRGLMEKLPAEHTRGNQKEILVYPVDRPRELEPVLVEDVLIGAISGENGPLYQRLSEHLNSKDVTGRVFHWLRPRLVTTLKLDPEATERARQAAADAVETQYKIYPAGHLLAKAGEPLGPDELRLLGLEYERKRDVFPATRAFYRSLALVALVLAMLIPCGLYISHTDRSLIDDFRKYAALLVMMVLTAGLARWLSADAWRAEIIPLLLFGMTIAIAYNRGLALLLSTVLAVVLVLALGQRLGNLLLLIGVVTSAVLLLSNIRSRSKLIYIGMSSAVVAFALTGIIGLLDERPLTVPILSTLLVDAGRYALWTLLVGFLITGLLPFIERAFGVLTDISLLELGDAAHPLLQELVRRAPGTYNHSINVASLAEAAAESIGARGLLVRVGAYFHDIGKMLKPGYFVENQMEGANRHETLVPAMSTLIIIAHVKDGADLARQHRLPQPIIDLIEQHHGTTLVEYFYHRASQQQGSSPDGGDVAESHFRYPGPKPQTREAAVLMLADAVESASRVLVEPTASRIQDIVEQITRKRLEDGQFDDCDLTFEEIRSIRDSLTKSLIAVYHGRVKYPDQRTA